MRAQIQQILKRSGTLLAAVFMLLQTTMPLTVYADGNGSPDACDSSANVLGSKTGTDNSVTVNVGAGKIASGVCIKSGENMFNGNQHSNVLGNGTYEDGCYQVTGVNTQSVTVTRLKSTNSCQAISHIDVVTAPSSSCLNYETQYRFRTRARLYGSKEVKEILGYDFGGPGTTHIDGTTIPGRWFASAGWHVIPDVVVNVVWGPGGVPDSVLGTGNVSLSVYGWQNYSGSNSYDYNTPAPTVSYNAHEVQTNDGYTEWSSWSAWSSSNPGAASDTKQVETKTVSTPGTCPGTIKVKKVEDKNFDGNQDNGEGYLAGWTVNIYNTQWQKVDTIATVNSQSDSSYVSVDLPYGSYYICEVQQTGWEQRVPSDQNMTTVNNNSGNTTEASKCYNVELTSNSKTKSRTFYNRQKPNGKLKVVKNLVNDDGGKKEKDDFSFKVSDSASVTQFEADGTNEITLPAGTVFDVVEVEENQHGYTTSYTNCEGTIVAGNTATCTITNDDIAPKLEITKRVINDNGGVAMADSFKLYVNGSLVSFGKGGGDVTDNSATGLYLDAEAGIAYTVSEDNKPGYQQVSITCVDKKTQSSLPHPVTLTLGQEAECTVTNNDKPSTIKVIKVVEGNEEWNGTKLPEDFVLKVDGQSVKTGDTLEVNSGWHYVSEIQQPGYKLVDREGNCEVLHGWIFVEAGKNYTCTLVNEAIPGSITVYKNVINDNGGNQKPWDFEIGINGNSDVDQGKAHKLAAGTHWIWEKDTTGYELKDITCWDGWNKVTPVKDMGKYGIKVNLKLDQHLKCWVTNDDIAPKVTVKKIAWGTPGTEFDFEINKVFFPDWFDYHFELSNFETFTTGPQMLATKVAISEEVPEGWVQTDATCSVKTKWGWDKLDSTTFWAENGKEYFCIFTNDQNGGISGHKFNDLDADGKWDEGEPGLEDWTIELYSKTWECDEPEISDAAAFRVQNERFHQDCEWVVSEDPVATTQTDENGAYNFNDLEYGWYKVCEKQQDGWTQTKPNPDWFNGCYWVEVGRWNWHNSHKDFGNKQHLIDAVLTPVCVEGFPYLDWSVKATNFTPTQFTFDWMPEGSNTAVSTTVTHPGDAGVNDDGNGTYTGRMLWPGANASLVTPDWPGWTLVNGKWVVDPSDVGGNLRPNATVKVTVNPSTNVAVSYPASGCDPSNGEVLGTDTLANTGTSGTVLSIMAALGLITVAGGIMLTRKQEK